MKAPLPADPEPPSLPAGARVAGYEIVRFLGRGGFGEVYEAEAAEEAGARVALKVLQTTEPGDVARFAREIRCAALLEHPNVPRVLDVGALPDGRPYYAMELLAGETLAERVARSGPRPLAEVAAIVRAIAAALGAAHARGIIHRDVKPSNVFLADRPVVLDFGIAKLLDDTNPPLTGSQAIVGSPVVMAPEQIAGAMVDARTDIYGLGAVAYYAASGRFPFAHEDPAILEQLVLSAEPAPLGRLVSAPPEVDRALRRALAKDPEARPMTAAELADELEHAVRGGEAVAAFVEVVPARPEEELDDAELARLGEVLPAVARALAAHGLAVDASAQDSLLLIGHGRAPDEWCERVAAAARALAEEPRAVCELAITIARGAPDRLRIVSSWLPAIRRPGVVVVP
jgi:serine/threonine-protein kinase